jgi:hypothetical protein
MQEAGVEAVAGSDGVDRYNFARGNREALRASLRERAFGAEFYNDQRN